MNNFSNFKALIESKNDLKSISKEAKNLLKGLRTSITVEEVGGTHNRGIKIKAFLGKTEIGSAYIAPKIGTIPGFVSDITGIFKEDEFGVKLRNFTD